MFCCQDTSDEARIALWAQAGTWLTERGYFSVERLFSNLRGGLSHLATPEDFAVFLRHLGFPMTKERKGDLFCLLSSTSLDERLAATSKAIAKQLEEAGGTLAFGEIAVAMPHLTAEALESIRAQFLPEVQAAEIGGVPCWCNMEAIPLPEDFSESLTTAVDTLVALGEKVTPANIEFALNLFYRTRFQEEYALLDKETFMRVCARHYRGGNDVFLNEKESQVGASDLPMPARRVRSPNTSFRNLGIPVAAELVYTKDPRISCIVLDDFNQVKYTGRAWAISALARQLLGVSSANGFRHFAYEGEVLSDRRSQMERADKQDKYHAAEMTPGAKVPVTEGGVIGLEGRPLSPTTWRAFRNAGTDPRVAEWARRVADGESVEGIAGESGLTVSTVKEYIMNRRRYFDVCHRNGIVPDGGADV